MSHVLNLLSNLARTLLASTQQIETLSALLENKRELWKNLETYISKQDKQGKRAKESTYQKVSEVTNEIQAAEHHLASAESRAAESTLSLKMLAIEAPDALCELRDSGLLNGAFDRILILKILSEFFPPPPAPPSPPPHDSRVKIFINRSPIPAQLSKIRQHVSCLQELFPYPNHTCPQLDILFKRGLSCREKLSELYNWNPEYCYNTLDYYVMYPA